jgi:hypothetical protein
MALETARYGIETVIVQPGAYTSGTDHFKHAVRPLDSEVVRQYGKLEGLSDQLADRLDGANLPGRRQDIGEIAEPIREIIAMAPGTRPKKLISCAVDVRTYALSANHVCLRVLLSKILRYLQTGIVISY